MIVVADTSPLNYLVRLGHSEILFHLYRRIVVPPAVLLEMRHPEAPSEVRAWASAPPEWLEEIGARNVDESLAVELGAGEREAISLAIELRADLLLVDDYAGRRAAEDRQLPVTGVLAVLLQAALRGYLNFPEEMESLRKLGFRCSPRLATAMLARHAEAGKRSSSGGA